MDDGKPGIRRHSQARVLPCIHGLWFGLAANGTDTARPSPKALAVASASRMPW